MRLARFLFPVACFLSACATALLAEEAKPEENVFTVGKITCHKKEKRLEMPAEFCLEEGQLEYALCARGGKDYESVLSVEAEPAELNLMLIALGYRAEPESVQELGDKRVPEGDALHITVEWELEGKPVRKRMEELIYNIKTKKPMRNTAWVYTGSKMVRDPETNKWVFLATLEKSIAAVYRDPAAIFNSPLDTGADDVFYTVYKELVPKKGTRARVILEPAAKEELAPEKIKDGAELSKPGEGADNPPNAPKRE